MAAAQFAIDTMIFDKIIETDATLELVCELSRAGALELCTIEVQERQLADVPDEAKRARLAEVPRTQMQRTSAILGEAILGHARLGTTGRIQSSQGDDDNSIAGEARARGLPLVTEDKRLRTQARANGITVQDWRAFLASIEALRDQV